MRDPPTIKTSPSTIRSEKYFSHIETDMRTNMIPKKVTLFVIFVIVIITTSRGGWWSRRRRRCPTNPCKWKWDSCSKSCGGGIRYPVKTQNQGQCGKCNLPKAQPCNAECCPIDCKWGSWENWSKCTETCGGGSQIRTRRYSGPSCGGKPCSGSQAETRACNEQCCAVNCTWAPWGEWGGCTTTCGSGFNIRHRQFATVASCSGLPCEGSGHELESCHNECCPTDCAWENWQTWSSCSALCGGGVQSRKRGQNPVSSCGGQQCVGDSIEERICNEECCAENCVWGEWGNWTSCTTSCGGGYQYRGRQVAVAAYCGGQECQGQDEEIKICNQECCPVDCSWNDWSDWYQCTKTCDSGMQSRERSIKTYASCGGHDCDGSTSDTRTCNDYCCPSECEFQPWNEWSVCSKTCGTGFQIRSREVEIGSSCNARKCQGDKTERRNCSMKCCPVNCKLSDWTTWSDCTTTCGVNGIQRRSRRVLQQAECGGIQCDIQEPMRQEQHCNRICFNGGIISVMDGCACVDGWTGECCQIDVNECDFNTCPDNSKCFNTAGSYECICNHHFTKRGEICDASNECSARGQNCHEQSECIGGQENYTCKCLPGFEGDGTVCEDIDECEIEDMQATIQENYASQYDMNISGNDKSPLCHDDATCTNFYGSYNCQCNHGYTGDGFVCADINECEQMDESNQDQIFDYSSQWDGQLNISSSPYEPTVTACSKYANCTNVPGGYSCWCESGYYGNGFTCEEINECSSEPCQNGGTCRDEINGFTCKCAEGYTGTLCGIDINDCDPNPCENNGTCVDQIKEYVCECPAGFTGATCENDINECETGNHVCDKTNGLCINTVGSYACECMDGFIAEGRLCGEPSENLGTNTDE